MKLYVANHSSHKTPGHHGTRKKFNIQARPRHWENQDGQVKVLTPEPDDLHDVQVRNCTMDDYRQRWWTRLPDKAMYQSKGLLQPGKLKAWVGVPPKEGVWDGRVTTPVRDGDTLLCSCSRAEAAQGRCHRVWAAKALLLWGWDVVLDGKPLEERWGEVHLWELPRREEHARIRVVTLKGERVEGALHCNAKGTPYTTTPFRHRRGSPPVMIELTQLDIVEEFTGYDWDGKPYRFEVGDV